MMKKANFVIRNENGEVKCFKSRFRGKYVIKVPQRCHDAVVVSAMREHTGIIRVQELGPEYKDSRIGRTSGITRVKKRRKYQKR